MHLGYSIKRIRESKRYSQQEIADLLNISQKKYSNFESCKTNLSVNQLVLLSKFLHFSLFELIRKIDPDITAASTQSHFTSNTSTVDSYKDNLLEKYQSMIKDKEEIILLLKEKINRMTQKH